MGSSRRPSKPIARTLYDYSSEDDYNDDGYVTGADEESFIHSQIVPFHPLAVGSPQLGLRSITTANNIFDKLMPYRSYRLKKTTDTRSELETTEVRVNLKNLTLTMNNHTFDGNDPVEILDFMTSFVNKQIC